MESAVSATALLFTSTLTSSVGKPATEVVMDEWLRGGRSARFEDVVAPRAIALVPARLAGRIGMHRLGRAVPEQPLIACGRADVAPFQQFEPRLGHHGVRLRRPLVPI